MYTYNDFLWFIKERESIRRKKESGAKRPWTDDPVLNSCRFTNIDRFNDRGTIILFDFIKQMTDWERMFYIVLYRSCYSSPQFINQMTGIWFHDLRNIINLKVKYTDSRTPYQIFLNRKQSVNSFLSSVAYRTAKDFYPAFCKLEESSILSASDILADIFLFYHKKRLKFLSTEIVKDLSFFYPDRINPDSICHMNIGALKALKLLPGYRTTIKIEKLLELTSINYSQLEHSLCEWGKYCYRREYYLHNGYFKKSWIYESS